MIDLVTSRLSKTSLFGVINRSIFCIVACFSLSRIFSSSNDAYTSHISIFTHERGSRPCLGSRVCVLTFLNSFHWNMRAHSLTHPHSLHSCHNAHLTNHRWGHRLFSANGPSLNVSNRIYHLTRWRFWWSSICSSSILESFPQSENWGNYLVCYLFITWFVHASFGSDYLKGWGWKLGRSWDLLISQPNHTPRCFWSFRHAAHYSLWMGLLLHLRSRESAENWTGQ